MGKLIIGVLLISGTFANASDKDALTLFRQNLSSDSRKTIEPTEIPIAFKIPVDPIAATETAVTKIINIGKMIWAVVEAGKPVVNQNYNTASALPAGPLTWTDMSDWSAPRSNLYRIFYKNLYGSTVVDFTYRLSFTYGGSYKGVGRYITGIRVQSANLSVLWGYNMDVAAEIPEVYNVGNSLSPIAAANVTVRWTVKTAMKSITQTDQFMVDGLGNVKRM